MLATESERRNASQPVIPLTTAGNDRKCLLAGGVMEFVGPSLGVPGHTIRSCPPRHRNKPLLVWYYQRKQVRYPIRYPIVHQESVYSLGNVNTNLCLCF